MLSMLTGAKPNRIGASGASDHQLIRCLADGSVVPMFVLDTGGIVRAWNRALETLTGVKASEIVGTRNHVRGYQAAHAACPADMLLSRLRSGDKDGGGDASASGDLISEQRWLDLPNGKRVFVALDAAPMRMPSGEPIGVMQTLRDLTEQHAAQQFVSRLLDEMAVPAFVLDRDRKVLFWNKACAELTGLPADKVVGTQDHWMGFYTAKRSCLADLLFEQGADVDKLYAVDRTAGSTTEARFAENWCQLPKGRRVYLAIDASPIKGEDGRMVAVVETLRDITAQKLAEEDLKSEKETQARHLADIVATLGGGLRRLAGGDLTVELDHRLPGEADQLRVDFNASVKDLRDAMHAVVLSSERIDDSVSALAQAANQLSQRTEKQAVSVEETSAATGELAGVLNAAAERAALTKDLISAAKAASHSSTDVIKRMMAAISAIRESSQQITTIISVVDEIAFQTNLLALNAGVEAARAGDAGRGFAVVASEVRSLAQRTAEAAKEITSLISRSTTQVERGFSLASETSRANDDIMHHVSMIDNGIAEIAIRSVSQASTLKQVNVAVAEIDQATQENASMAEEASAACHSLAEESSMLVERLARFQVQHDDRFAPVDRHAEVA